MLYIKTTDVALGAAMPYKSSMINWNLLNESLLTNGIYSSITNDNAYSSNFYVLNGIIKSGSGTYAISSGYILAQGSVIAVSAATGLTPAVGQTIIGTISDDFTLSTGLGYDPVTFSDGTTHNVHVNQVITWSVGTSGSGSFDYDDLIFFNGAETTYDTYVKYSKSLGNVKIQGIIGSGYASVSDSAGSTAFTLPVGYRPTSNKTGKFVYYDTSGGNVVISGSGTLTVDTNGKVYFSAFTGAGTARHTQIYFEFSIF